MPPLPMPARRRPSVTTPVIVLMDQDRATLAESARLIVREIQREGFTARIGTVNTVEAWLGSLPGHAIPNVRRPLIHTGNLADLLPLAGVWTDPCPLYPPWWQSSSMSCRERH
jgi:type IV secretion system protein TrbE